MVCGGGGYHDATLFLRVAGGDERDVADGLQLGSRRRFRVQGVVDCRDNVTCIAVGDSGDRVCDGADERGGGLA